MANNEHILEVFTRELWFAQKLAPYCFGKTFVDVGANCGAATMMLSPHSKDVVSIEPNRELVDFIKSKLFERKINNVKVINAAATDKTGVIDMFMSTTDSPLSSAFEENLSSRPLVIVDVDVRYNKKTVDAIAIDDLNLCDVGAMKIDVEGFEGNVLRGAQKTIKRDRPAILWERSVALPQTTNHLAEEILDSMGYTHTVVNRYSNIHDDVLSVCSC